MVKPVSITEVAADAGVSPTTVSHALSGKRPVSEETSARIQASIERLGYRRDLVAASMRSQRTHTVGLLVVDITNPYYPAMARGAHDVLTAGGYIPFILNTDGDAATEEEFLRQMIARKVDGIIIVPLALTVVQIREIVGPDLPLVVIATSEQAGIAADVVTADQELGIREAVQHLHAHGITDIGLVSGPEGSYPGVARLAMYDQTMEAYGLEVRRSWLQHADGYTRDGGFIAASRLFDQHRRPRAVVCANDLIAIGVIDAARVAGLRVPDDLAIIGFDNIEIADLVSPRLTTIDNQAAALGSASAELLLERMTGDATELFRCVTLPTRLLVRSSA